jgi:hypothetical protein
MTYALQFITFLLAAVGTLYKSVKTDTEGNYVRSKRGLPVPTRAGTLILICVTLFFFLSIYVTWKNSNEAKAKEARLDSELTYVQGQNGILQRELDKVVNPIKEVDVTLLVDVPLEHPELKSYQHRLLKGIEAYLTAPKNSQRSNPDVEMPAQTETARPVYVRHRSSLLPRSKTEPLAYALLNEIEVFVMFTKTPIVPRDNKIEVNEIKIDLNIQTHLDVSFSTSTTDFVYDPDEKRFTLTHHDENLNYRSWMGSGKIVSIDDLLGAQLIVQIYGAPQAFNDPEMNHRLVDIFSLCNLNYLVLEVAGRYRFNFPGGEMKRYLDSEGFPVYIYDFPKTIEELKAGH